MCAKLLWNETRNKIQPSLAIDVIFTQCNINNFPVWLCSSVTEAARKVSISDYFFHSPTPKSSELFQHEVGTNWQVKLSHGPSAICHNCHFEQAKYSNTDLMAHIFSL